jgi:hypothetical protein
VKSLFHNARYAHHIPISSKYNLSNKYGFSGSTRLVGKNQRALSSHLLNKQNGMSQFVPGISASSMPFHQQSHPQPLPSATDSLVALHTGGLTSAEIKAISTGVSLDLPDRETIALRMRSVAMDMGLSQDINQDCVNLVMQSMQTYLKNLIAKCIKMKNNKLPKELLKMRMNQEFRPKKGTFLVKKSPFSVQLNSNTITRPVHSYCHYPDEVPYLMLTLDQHNKKSILKKRKRDEFESDDQPYNDDYTLDDSQMLQIVQQDAFVITPRDLLTTVECSPFLLGDCEKVREKISMSNWDLFN